MAAALVGAAAHRRGRVRGVLPYALMGAAMAAMAAPDRDPLGPGGWTVVLGLAAAWALGRPGARAGRPGTALDLYAMAVLTLVAPAAHPAGHAGHDAGWWHGPYLALLVLWGGCAAGLALRPVRVDPGEGPRRRTRTAELACTAGMSAAMALMVHGM
ncbi:DUF5134 domain-containing protein [Yinghuangia seranimata]|uniref:DUF5134 domain-containing protein n=1 Tax=Yinghuangia seranimata TaxID=408067 RepID=UPI00248BA8E8|nr:DUF5134 domain-containing protein [Yinghuangia seranimata]MDI2132111.1 DUF5134 domain-containing protein [Yinghuangia seranimata]